MSKNRVNSDPDELVKIRLTIDEWREIFNENNKRLVNHHELFYRKLFPEVCPLRYRQNKIKRATKYKTQGPLINVQADCLSQQCQRYYTFLVYEEDIQSNQVTVAVKIWGRANHVRGETRSKRKARGNYLKFWKIIRNYFKFILNYFVIRQ